MNLFLSGLRSPFLTKELIVNTPNTHILAIRSILGSNLPSRGQIVAVAFCFENLSISLAQASSLS